MLHDSSSDTMYYHCLQVVRVSKAEEVQRDAQVSPVSLETREPMGDREAEEEMAPRDSSDHLG